jgi:hypothetical protein
MEGKRIITEASGISLLLLPFSFLMFSFFSYLRFYSFNHLLKSFPRLSHYLNLFPSPCISFFIFSFSFRSYHPHTTPSGTSGTCTRGVRDGICAGIPAVLIEFFRGILLILQSNFWKTILNQAAIAPFLKLSN